MPAVCGSIEHVTLGYVGAVLTGNFYWPFVVTAIVYYGVFFDASGDWLGASCNSQRADLEELFYRFAVFPLVAFGSLAGVYASRRDVSLPNNNSLSRVLSVSFLAANVGVVAAGYGAQKGDPFALIFFWAVLAAVAFWVAVGEGFTTAEALTNLKYGFLNAAAYWLVGSAAFVTGIVPRVAFSLGSYAVLYYVSVRAPDSLWADFDVWLEYTSDASGFVRLVFLHGLFIPVGLLTLLGLTLGGASDLTTGVTVAGVCAAGAVASAALARRGQKPYFVVPTWTPI